MSKKRRRPTMKEKRQAEAEILPCLMGVVLVVLIVLYVLDKL